MGGSLAHFETRIIPINDPSMRIEWYQNGKQLSTGSRIKTISDFGFVILEVANVMTRDAGNYTCKATNRHGETSVSCQVQVKSRQGIDTNPHDITCYEGQPAHFDCRIEPIGDGSMRVDWFHDDKPIQIGSRIHTINDFGFVVLDIDWTFKRDSGTYKCVATNKCGSAEVTVNLQCRSKKDIIIDSQLPNGMSMDRLKELEAKS